MQSSILSKFRSNVGVMNAINAAASEYANGLYLQRNSALPWQCSDGMALHGVFNRMLVEHLARFGPDENIRFFLKKEKEENDLLHIGDVVFHDGFKGQNRLLLLLGGLKYQTVHMKGDINDYYLNVASIGKARKEYCENQNKSVPKRAGDFLDVLEQQGVDVPDARPLRLILVTQIGGPTKDELTLWGCVHDGRFDEAEGRIYLAEREILLQASVRDLASKFRVEPKVSQEESEYGFDISRKQGEA